MIHIQSHDRRFRHPIGQRFSQPVDTDDAGRFIDKIFPCDNRGIEDAAGGEIAECAAARFCIGADQRRQAADQPGSHRAIAISVQATALSDKGRRRLAISFAKFSHDCCRHTGNRGNFCRRITGQHFSRQAVKPAHPAVQEITIQQAQPLQFMHDPQRQCTVCTRSHQNRPVGNQSGGFRDMGLNDPYFCPLALRLSDRMQKMDVCCQRMSAPNQDKIALCRFIGFCLQCAAHYGFPTIPLGRRTQGTLQSGRAKLMEQRMAGIALHQSHRACIRHRQDRFAAILGDYFSPALTNDADSFLPRCLAKFASAFFTCTNQRLFQPLRRVDAPFVVRHFGAKQSACIGMRRIAFDSCHFFVFHLQQQSAGVRTVIGADGFFPFVAHFTPRFFWLLTNKLPQNRIEWHQRFRRRAEMSQKADQPACLEVFRFLWRNPR